MRGTAWRRGQISAGKVSQIPWEIGLSPVQRCWRLRLAVLDAEQPRFSRAQGVTDTQFAAWQQQAHL